METVELERVISIHPVIGWNARGNCYIQCGTITDAILNGAVFVRRRPLGASRTKALVVYRVLADGDLRQVDVQWR